MKLTDALIIILALTGCCNHSQQPADYVNPFIGANTNTEKAGASHGLGKTFPGAATPFGLVQLSPNTITGGDNAPGYSDEHTTIEGFAFTQMSGTGWYGDLGNFLVAYYNFVNAYHRYEQGDDSFGNICCLAIDRAKELLKGRKKK